MRRPPTRLVHSFLFAAAASTSLMVASLAGCNDNPTAAEDRGPAGEGNTPLRPSVPLFGALAGHLPSTDTVTSSIPGFEIKQKGGGIAGRFEITNPNSAAIALDGVTAGTGHGLLAWNLGLGRGAVVITSNSSNTLPALDVSSQSLGTPTLAAAADFRANNSNSTHPAMRMTSLGKGPLFVANHRGTSGALAVFQLNGTNRIRFGRNGRGFFNGGTQSSGADVAEVITVEGEPAEYAPGELMAISTRSDRRVERVAEPYSTRVIGVYATKPGVLLTERDIDANLDDAVPVGVIGIVPTRVSSENGPIHRGDMLVSSSTPGHAMLGTDRERMLGAVIGKAMAEFTEEGTGLIEVLVNVR
jgi:hypothetical protein